MHFLTEEKIKATQLRAVSGARHTFQDVTTFMKKCNSTEETKTWIYFICGRELKRKRKSRLSQNFLPSRKEIPHLSKTLRKAKSQGILSMSKETREDTRLQQRSAEGNSVVTPVWTEYSKGVTPCEELRQQYSTSHRNKQMHWDFCLLTPLPGQLLFQS